MLVARVVARAHTQLGCIFVDRIADVEWPGNIRETIRRPFSVVAAPKAFGVAFFPIVRAVRR